MLYPSMYQDALSNQ